MAWLIALTISLIYIAVTSAGSNKVYALTSSASGTCAFLVRTAALDEYFIYITITNIGLAAASSMSRVSNHAVLTLDIIFNLSILFLILYNRFKDPDSLPFI
jgi:hypothetical protein